MRKLILTIGFVMLLLGTAPIATATPNSNSIVEDGIEYYIQTDKSVYNLGEDGDVDILYRVSNLTNDDVTLGWVIADPLAYYDFRVTQGDNQIWRYFHMVVVLGFEPYDLGPYESKEFQTIWNMMNDNGTRWPKTDDFLINPGVYNIIGELDLVPGERVPVSVSIEVIPEPATLFLLGLGAVILKNLKNKKTHFPVLKF